MPHPTRPRPTASAPDSMAVAQPAPSGDSARWLFLIHQIPPKPDYLRVKIGRRLQRVGAVALKNSVYVLPATAESLEDFQWIAREIEEGGGEAFISDASLVSDGLTGLTDDDVRTRFDAARNEAYGAVLADAKAVLATARRATSKRSARTEARATGPGSRLAHEVAKLRRRFEVVKALDFFGAARADATAATIAQVERLLAEPSSGRSGLRLDRTMDGATWVTRRDVHVDRIASAWVIARFIDRRPVFRFVEPAGHSHREGELRFDMFEAEYTHVGDACTFETLVSTFLPTDLAMREVGEIVHDVDCKDDRFGRDEAPGLARLIAGIAARFARDEDRLEQGALIFDALYAAFGSVSALP
ncbi:MAG: chromate resistance protein ChrB domain-containing protein [Gemmatimonadaceae bacterium]